MIVKENFFPTLEAAIDTSVVASSRFDFAEET
jgi:hypothetical protein